MIRRTQRLYNGREMPTVGLGTWQLTDPDVLEKTIRTVIGLGYRHIDTAFIYGNQTIIGGVLKKLFDSGVVRREDLFITSKLWSASHGNAEEAIRNTLKELQMDYVDLYLIHWPVTLESDPKGSVDVLGSKHRIVEFDPVGLWKKMESFVDSGFARSIGISNFGVTNTKRILESCRIRPAVSQFELHPYLPQKDLVRFLKSEDIQVVSYSPFGSTTDSPIKVRNDVAIGKMAEKYKCTPSQIILGYIAMQGICVIPRSTNKQHLEENLNLKELEKEDFDVINNLGITKRYVDFEEFGPSRFL